jgi:hypothetical protein
MKSAWALPAAALLVLAAAPAPAQPPLPAHYSFDYDGTLNALHLTGEVKVLSLHIEERAGKADFATDAEMHSYGVLRLLRAIDITTHATGPVGAGLPQPHSFVFDTLEKRRLKHVSLTWTPRGVIEVPPHHDNGDPPLTPAVELTASDPVTLFSRAVYAPSGQALCARNWRFFDGAVVYELQLRAGGAAPVQPGDHALGVTGAVICQVRYTEVAGFRHKPGDRRDEGLRSDIHVTFGQLGPAGPWIFVSMKADTALGDAAVQLTRVAIQR